MPNDKIQFIIDNLQENLAVEVKNWLGGLQSNDHKAALAKEIISLANNGGGYIFIGFEDAGDGHPEIDPEPGELEAFTQDVVASIVDRHVTPPCQCSVEFYRRQSSDVPHPVISVPGDHRTPVWAKGGSPDGRTLQAATVYVRRPGGYSESARTQDDWERLIDRLVKARQTEQLDAIRDIMSPNTNLVAPTRPSLEAWDEESYAAWQTLLEGLPSNSPHRLTSGHWTFSFSIEPFEKPSLVALNRVLDREMPNYSGWPPFTYIHRKPLAPNAHGELIQAWMAEDPEGREPDASHSDFWRISRNGQGFLLRPMQEDRPEFGENRTPKPRGPFFDWTLPVYRATELLKYVEALGLQFSDENAEFNVLLKYYGTMGRKLHDHNWRYNLREGARCTQPILESRMTAKIHSIRTNIEEWVHSLLTPIFEQFEFQELPKLFVDNVIKDVLGFRRYKCKTPTSANHLGVFAIVSSNSTKSISRSQACMASLSWVIC
jgi:hypothetical protein